MKFYLRRKTGYMSAYSLAMLYPSYRKGVHYQGSRGEYVAEIYLNKRYKLQPWMVRFPSYVARIVKLTDKSGATGMETLALTKLQRLRGVLI